MLPRGTDWHRVSTPILRTKVVRDAQKRKSNSLSHICLYSASEESLLRTGVAVHPVHRRPTTRQQQPISRGLSFHARVRIQTGRHLLHSKASLSIPKGMLVARIASTELVGPGPQRVPRSHPPPSKKIRRPFFN